MSTTTRILVAVAWADLIVQTTVRVILWILKWAAILFVVSFILALIAELIRRL